MAENSHAFIGTERQDGQPKNQWEVSLDVDEKTGIDPRLGVVPRDFFITTGEATVKTDFMIKAAQDLLKYARNLQKKFKKSKGESVYLETEWREGKLIVKNKNPKKGRSTKANANNPQKAEHKCIKCGRKFQNKAALTSHAKTCKAKRKK